VDGCDTGTCVKRVASDASNYALVPLICGPVGHVKRVGGIWCVGSSEGGSEDMRVIKYLRRNGCVEPKEGGGDQFGQWRIEFAVEVEGSRL
jgi:hypothetical protein